MLTALTQTADFIKSKTGFTPDVGIILGSGLGGLVAKMQIEHTLPYSELPNFPVSTVAGHGSRLIMGTLGNTKVVVMQGRFHFYEGYTFEQLTFPVRVLKFLGIKKLFLSNAAGGMNTNFKVGDLMVIDDHINLMPGNPLIGKNIDELGPRFPDMSAPYDIDLQNQALQIAAKKGYRCHTGVYAAVSGPTYETRAEYKFLRTIGADAVGMSTVPEVMVARHMDLPCFAMSIITDLGGMELVETITHEEVLKVAAEAEVKMTAIVMQMLA
ncbi:MAG: purine-nucleoside phosphorylase [Bacteroidia bacterium]|nr:purine-nucleoside phosphorylase [Bacteroidia bacterium]